MSERASSLPGLATRQGAVALLETVLAQGRPLDEALEQGSAARALGALSARDRAFARAIVATTLRRKGQIDAVLKAFLAKGMPSRSGPLAAILAAAACQLLFLHTPAHAAIGLAVQQCKQDRLARRYDKLANAVLRRVAAEGPAMVAGQDAARLNTPDWLWRRWAASYGEATARAIAEAHLGEAPLDLTVPSDTAGWAARLSAVVLPTGSLRRPGGGRVEELPGFAEGAWWVQDAAAALPARLLGDVAARRVADLCAAPGGKTAQLAQAGARVTAVDVSPARLARLAANLRRLGLTAELVEADARHWAPGTAFDAVLLDAPCLATGTVRRHPDIPHRKGARDLAALVLLQRTLLDRAAELVRPGGMLVYCVCSLEPEEGEQQVEALLARRSDLRLEPIAAGELAGGDDWLTPQGWLRILPHHSLGPGPELRGLDGFFAARMRRIEA